MTKDKNNFLARVNTTLYHLKSNNTHTQPNKETQAYLGGKREKTPNACLPHVSLTQEQERLGESRRI